MPSPSPATTDWIPIGPVNAGPGLPADTVVAAATRIISNKLVASDAQPAWQVLGNGQMNFGAGGATATDTNLYRASAGLLATDGIIMTAGSGTGTAFGVAANTGTAPWRWRVRKDAVMQWGDGTNPPDTTLAWNNASTLNLSGSIYMGTGSAAGGAFAGMAASGDTYSRVDMTNNGLIRFSPGNAAQDVTVHRYNANQLGTYGDLVLGTGSSGRGALYCNYTAAAANQVWVGQYGGNVPYAGITFGQDTYLYRYSAGILSTDGRLAVGSTAAFSIQTSGGIIIDLNNGQNAIYFGSAADATIYRSAASVLTVGCALNVTGGITNASLPVRIQNNVAANSWAGKDLNTATENGWYYCSSSTTNTPIASDVYVMVMSHGGPGSGLVMQVAYYYYANQSYYRTLVGGGTWTAWQQTWPLTDAAISAGRPALAAVGGQVPGNDFNGALNNGWYCAQPGTANSPKGISGYWAVEVINITYTGACRQIAYQHGSYAVFQRYQNGAGSWSNWWQVSPAVYQTTPPVNPQDGEEWVLTDSASSPNFTWKMRYNASNSTGYPWEFVGGAPWFTINDGEFGTVSASWVGGSGDVNFTAPRTGVYLVEYGCEGRLLGWNVVKTYNVSIGYAVAGTPVTSASFLEDSNQFHTTTSQRHNSIVNAGQVISLIYSSNDANGQAGFNKRYLQVTPLKVS